MREKAAGEANKQINKCKNATPSATTTKLPRDIPDPGADHLTSPSVTAPGSRCISAVHCNPREQLSSGLAPPSHAA